MIGVFWVMLCSASVMADYSTHPRAEKFVADAVAAHQLDEEQVWQALRLANTEQRILDSMANSAEKTKTWAQYRTSFVTDLRISQGKTFMLENAELLARAEAEYGVPPQVVTAILGVETNYGGYTGKTSILNALATFGFEHPRRSKFFLSELANYIALVEEQNWQIEKQQGSYAGAMGLSQFMPSNYRTLAVDFDSDGDVDLFSKADAIGSVANYLRHHGWAHGEPVAILSQPTPDFDVAAWSTKLKPSIDIADLRNGGLGWMSAGLCDGTLTALVSLEGAAGQEHWLGLQNFYVISRYNPRAKYAMAVFHLSEELLRDAS